MQQPSSLARFSDDDDARLFQSCRYPHDSWGGRRLANEILRIKHNDHMFKHLQVRDYRQGVYLNDAASRRIGEIIGQSTHLKRLEISSCWVDVEALCAGLQNNRSIQKFQLVGGIDLHNSEKMSCLAPFLAHNHRLKIISLTNCRLGPASIDVLANALSDGTGNNLEELNLDYNPIGDGVDGLIQALRESGRLRILSLVDCRIGPWACSSLVTLLDNQQSNLTDLYLCSNYMNNQSAITFAGSLVNNKRLRILSLGGNILITAEGWRVMLQLVFNSTSISDVANSNHVLRSLDSVLTNKCIEALGDDDGNLLCASLKLNKGDNKLLITRRKIIWGHARGDINIGEASIVWGAMPRILAWIGNDSNRFDAKLIQYHKPPLREPKIGTIRVGGIFRILRSMPDLCNRERAENVIAREQHAPGGAKRKRDEA